MKYILVLASISIIFIYTLPSAQAQNFIVPGREDEKPLRPLPENTYPNFKGNIEFSSRPPLENAEESLQSGEITSQPSPEQDEGVSNEQKNVFSFWWLFVVLLPTAGLVSYFYAKGRREAKQN